MTSITEITPMNAECSYCINSRVVNSIDQYLPVFAGIWSVFVTKQSETNCNNETDTFLGQEFFFYKPISVS